MSSVTNPKSDVGLQQTNYERSHIMTIQTIKFHKRSTGMTGQVLASPEIEYKLARVEKSFKAFYGVSLGRYKLYNLALDFARQSKFIDGGYIHYSAQAITGIFIEAMHKT